MPRAAHEAAAAGRACTWCTTINKLHDCHAYNKQKEGKEAGVGGELLAPLMPHAWQPSILPRWVRGRSTTDAPTGRGL